MFLTFARAVLTTAAFVTASQATILTFDFTPPLVGNDPVPQSYGDNVTATIMGSFGYGMGNGFTPNITASYQTLNADGTQKHPNVLFWPNQYSTLTNFAISNSSPDDVGFGEITLTPSGGLAVRINSFAMAAYDTFTTGERQRIRILDLGGTVLWDGSQIIAQGSVTTFNPAITSFGPLRLQFGNDWFVGIDNIDFDEVNIPEPSSALLLGVGAALIGLVRRRRA